MDRTNLRCTNTLPFFFSLHVVKQKKQQVLPAPDRNYSTQQTSFQDARTYTDDQKIPRNLRNLKDHYHIHESPSLGHIDSQLTPVHTVIARFLRIHANIIVPIIACDLRVLYIWFRFSEQSLAHIASHAICPAHPIILNLIKILARSIKHIKSFE